MSAAAPFPASAATGWPYLLVPFIPIAIALDLAHAGAALIFVSSALGVIPTAALMGRATEELAERSGPGIGGLLNVTFGNAPELIIALFALHKGLQEVVKASLIGSILGNILLVMGAAMLVGGLEARAPEFDRDRGQRAGADAAAGRGRARDAGDLPARRGRRPAEARAQEASTSAATSSTCRSPSRSCCCITYVAGLFFSLKTHRDLFNPEHRRGRAAASRGRCAGP